MKKIIRTLLVVMVVALALAAFTACQLPGTTTPTEPAECQHTGTLEYLPGKSSTCTEDGLMSGFRCPDCGVDVVPQEVDKADGHKWVEATCTTVKYCSVCELTEGEALGHNLVDVEALAPTTCVDGYTAHKACDREGCDYTEGKEDVYAPHNIPEENQFYYPAPTCTEGGYLAGQCADCGDAFYLAALDPLGHDMSDATCTKAATCQREGCDHTEGEALGHNLVDVEAKAHTCIEDGYSAHKACDREGCDYTEGREVDAAAHTLLYTVTVPTATTTGKTVVTCTACESFETITYGEVSAMGNGTYVLTASDEGLAGTAEGTYTNGQVYVHNNVWEMHLSAKFKVDGSQKTFDDETYLETRLNYGGKTEFKSNGYIKNGIVFTTTGCTTVTVYWVQGGDDHRQVALYDLNGNIVAQSDDQTSVKNDPVMTTFTVPAGTYVLGNVVNTNYHFKVVVDVVDHDYAEATCTTPKTCKVCGGTEGTVAPHSYNEHGVCGCGATTPVDYYLIGWINGADHGNAGDWQNLGNYKLVDGKLTVKFDADSYLGVKSADAEGNILGWFWAESYVETTEGTFAHGKDWGQKIKVPGGVKLTITMEVNEDGSLKLSYHTVVDANVDAKCDNCGDYYMPLVGEAFKLQLVQGKLDNKVLYFAGKMNGYYYETTNIDGAADLYIEVADGGYYIYYLDGETKTYLYAYTYESDGKTKVSQGITTDVTKASVWSWNSENGVFTTVLSGTEYYIGTYNTYTTMSVSKLSYLSTSFPARVLVTTDHTHTWDDGVVTEPTCVEVGYTTKTCTVCLSSQKFDEVAASGSHNVVDCVCTVCGANVHTYTDGKCTCGVYEPVTVSIADYADANSWEDATAYNTLVMNSNITVTAVDTVGDYHNTAKYYENGENWRMYQGESPTITVKATDGMEIVSVKITYGISNTGVLTLNEENVASGTEVSVNANSVVFGVGNTGTKTNGQVRITSIEVVYRQANTVE